MELLQPKENLSSQALNIDEVGIDPKDWRLSRWFPDVKQDRNFVGSFDQIIPQNKLSCLELIHYPV
ncbi:hypothetical protein E4U44_006555 [Claviceps purpurea]|nr:hypothetical protein E4U44_006555 [Claviceps purpurea]